MIEELLVGVPDEIIRPGGDAISRFEKVTGIKHTRRFDGSTIDMIKQTLSHMKLIDVPDNLLVVTQSPDRFSPCMATEIHAHLDFPGEVLAFDVNHACDGWVLGVYLANRLKGRTMLICVDRLRYGDSSPDNLIFSDSCSITMIKAQGSDFQSFTEGTMVDKLYCGLNGDMKMDGDAVFDFVSKQIPDFIRCFSPAEYLCPHQANLSMLKLLEARSGYKDKTLYSIEYYGNQSMNSIPTCLALNEDSLWRKTVLCVGFGAGFTAAGMTIYWQPMFKSRIVEI